MSQLPAARNQNIIEQDLDKELLIYDLQTNSAYSLNETSKIIYRACSESLSFDDLKRQYKFDDDFINFALSELNSKNLLEGYSADNFPGMNRREVIKKVGLASMIALPVIASIVAPRATNAASGLLPNGAACSTANPTVCASGACSGPKQTCCNRNGPNNASDLATCTTTTDCCLSTTTSRCQGGVCCRNAGINCAGGANNTPMPQLCCSNSCTFKQATGQTTCD